MEFAFESPWPMPDVAPLDRALAALDPAALVDLDASGCTIRMATVLTRMELLSCLEAAGLPPEPSRLRQLPSVCCGGCGG
jgi:hypothetical protein